MYGRLLPEPTVVDVVDVDPSGESVGVSGVVVVTESGDVSVWLSGVGDTLVDVVGAGVAWVLLAGGDVAVCVAVVVALPELPNGLEYCVPPAPPAASPTAGMASRTAPSVSRMAVSFRVPRIGTSMSGSAPDR